MRILRFIKRLILNVYNKYYFFRIRQYYSKDKIEHTRLGTKYGGWYIPNIVLSRLNEEAICYCFGAGEDISFEVELINKTNCQAYTFDPTPRAKKHYNRLVIGTAKDKKILINNSIESGTYNISIKKLKHLKFYEYGVSGKNGAFKFYEPINPKFVSHSMLNLQKTKKYFTAQCYTIKTIMLNLNHARVDLIKFDIEGAEYQVIDSIIKDGIVSNVVCFEIHKGNKSMNSIYINRIYNSVKKLTKYGYILTIIDEWNCQSHLEMSYFEPFRNVIPC